MLQPEDYINVIANTQLVSIDLIVLNDEGKVLVGKRVNRPSQNMWFVPGSRLYKNETIEEGVKRVSRTELGVEIQRSDTTLINVYDHIYPDNFLGRADKDGVMIPTHYVAIGMRVTIDPALIVENVFMNQHSSLEWMSISELLARDDVHQNTKNFFS